MISTLYSSPLLTASAKLRTQSNRPHRIMLIEDNPYLCHYSAEILINHGFEVNAAEDGVSAWKELKSNSYNLVITEQHLPKLSGLALVKKLRSARMVLPAIITTTTPREDFKSYPWLQPASILLKPYTFTDLLSKVKEFLASRGDILTHLPSPNRFTRPSRDGLQF